MGEWARCLQTFPFTVYKVRLQDFTKSLSTDIYTVQVLDVIKEGEHQLPTAHIQF